MIYLQLAFAFLLCPVPLVLVIMYEYKHGLIEFDWDVDEPDDYAFERYYEPTKSEPFEIVIYNKQPIINKPIQKIELEYESK